jgi:hypothetical protein
VIHIETGRKVVVGGDPKVERVMRTETGGHVKEAN